jgi:cyclic di-GMP phosphodiesterase
LTHQLGPRPPPDRPRHLKSLRIFACVLPLVRWHHEKPNGRGYPDGLIGDQIPILARIVSVADVFDALSTDRIYRKALPLPKCCEIMTAMAGDGDLDLDLDLVRALAEMLNTQSGVQAA